MPSQVKAHNGGAFQADSFRFRRKTHLADFHSRRGGEQKSQVSRVMGLPQQLDGLFHWKSY